MKSLLARLILLFAMTASLQSVALEKVRLTNGEWEPWLSENLKYHGVVSRIVTEAFAIEGVNVEYGFYPWKRAYHNARIGEYDGSVVWSRKKEREEDFFYSDEVFTDEKVFFHRKDTEFDWKKIDDLMGVNIGATLGYTYGAEFDEAASDKRIHVNYRPRDEQNLRMILKKRVDIFPCNKRAGLEIIKRSFSPAEAEEFVYHPKIVYTKPYHLIISKNAGARGERLIEIFNRGLKRLRESGNIEQFFMESESGAYMIPESGK